MIYIAHRGLFEGPNIDLENKPEQIELAISKGFDCEIDLWVTNGELFLGHDKPTYKTNYNFLSGKPLWIHAKNFEALNWLCNKKRKFNYFWHQNDDYTITSDGYIWTYPSKKLSERSVCNQPEWYIPVEKLANFNETCYAICSKYVGLMKKVTK